MRICPKCRRQTEARVCPHDGFQTQPVRAQPDEDPLLGTTFVGRYRIDSVLGRGGMGAVYRAEQLAVGRPVALKILHERLLDDLSEVTRFQEEARAIAALKHPNTIRLIDFGQTDDGTLFLVMEYLEGEPLNDLLAREAPLDPARAVRITRQILGALGEAHAQGIVHRDMKPQNVMIVDVHDQPDFVKVLDFGIAKRVGGGAPSLDLTRTGIAIGSPRYMSPEQARAREVTPRADIYAVGCILYEMITGGPVFRCETASEYIIAHVKEEPPPPRLGGKLLHGPLVDLVMQMLAKDPEDRPLSADVTAHMLTTLLEGPLLERGAPPPPDEVSATRAKTIPLTSAIPEALFNPQRATGSAAGPPRRRTVPLMPAKGLAATAAAPGSGADHAPARQVAGPRVEPVDAGAPTGYIPSPVSADTDAVRAAGALTADVPVEGPGDVSGTQSGPAATDTALATGYEAVRRRAWVPWAVGGAVVGLVAVVAGMFLAPHGPGGDARSASASTSAPAARTAARSAPASASGTGSAPAAASGSASGTGSAPAAASGSAPAAASASGTGSAPAAASGSAPAAASASGTGSAPASGSASASAAAAAPALARASGSAPAPASGSASGSATASASASVPASGAASGAGSAAASGSAPAAASASGSASAAAAAPAPARASGSAPAPASGSAPAPAPATVVVTVITRPPGAAVVLDGASAGVSPALRRVPKSSSPLKVKATLDGYRSATAQVVPDRDRVLQITLKRRARRTKRARRGDKDILFR